MIAVVYPSAAAPYAHEAGLGVPGPSAGAEPAPRACRELRKDGEPCQGTPGDDGLCAAHKPKGDSDAGAVAAAVDADPPA